MSARSFSLPLARLFRTKAPRPMNRIDYEFDRLGVEVRQRMELTSTNRS